VQQSSIQFCHFAAAWRVSLIEHGEMVLTTALGCKSDDCFAPFQQFHDAGFTGLTKPYSAAGDFAAPKAAM
jgi:hypothetical protein